MRRARTGESSHSIPSSGSRKEWRGAEFLNEATLIGDRLVSDLSRRSGLDVPGLKRSPAFGSGLSGVAFFLAQLYEATRVERYRRTSLELADLLRHALGGLSAEGGWLSGRSGIAHALLRIGLSIQEEDFIRAGCEHFLGCANERAASPEVYDGECGKILLLIDAFRRIDDERLLHAAIRVGAGVLQRVEHDPTGIFLERMDLTPIPLLGVAHGASGLALAMLAVARYDQDPVWAYVARSALEYEDGWYRAEAGTWVDGRLFDDPRKRSRTELQAEYRRDRFGRYDELRLAHPIAWCNGRAGLIGARLWAQHLLSFPRPTDEGRSPLGENGFWSVASGHIEDFSYCCGFASVAEVFRLAEAMGIRPGAGAASIEIGLRCIERRRTTGSWLMEWQRVPGRPYNGITKGIAGIGYCFLHLYSPAVFTPLMTPGLAGPAPVQCGAGRPSNRLGALRQRLLSKYWGTDDASNADRGRQLEEYVAECVALSIAQDEWNFAQRRRGARAPGDHGDACSDLEAARWRRDRERRVLLRTAVTGYYYQDLNATELLDLKVEMSCRTDLCRDEERGFFKVLLDTAHGARVLVLQGAPYEVLTVVVRESEAISCRAIIAKLHPGPDADGARTTIEILRQLLRMGILIEDSRVHARQGVMR